MSRIEAGTQTVWPPVDGIVESPPSVLGRSLLAAHMVIGYPWIEKKRCAGTEGKPIVCYVAQSSTAVIDCTSEKDREG